MEKIKEEHLKDIDFRTRKERQLKSIPEVREYLEWCLKQLGDGHSDWLQGQRTAYSQLLWHVTKPDKKKKKKRKQ